MIVWLNKLISGSQDQWNMEESTGELNNLINEFVEDNDFMMSNSTLKEHEANDLISAKVGYWLEETKHDNNSFSDSINAEIDQMLLGNFPSPRNPSGIISGDKHYIRKSTKFSRSKFGKDSPNLSGRLLRVGSNNSEYERLASMILNENSKAKDKKDNSRNGSNSKIVEKVLKKVSSQQKLEETEIMLLENNDNQPTEIILERRKAAAQYTPYGIFEKQLGGLRKTSKKIFVRADLMFYSKYDQRLVAEVVTGNKNK